MEKYGTARQATQDNIMRHICIECWTNKAADTYSEHVLCNALPLQQWLHECPSVLL